jgi:hypothetical protein
MPVTVHLRRHEAVPKTGSYEVWYSDGRPSRYFYWDDERVADCDRSRWIARQPCERADDRLEYPARPSPSFRHPSVFRRSKTLIWRLAGLWAFRHSGACGHHPQKIRLAIHITVD